MENNSLGPYFTPEDLHRFKAAEGKILTKVKCYLWQNQSNKDDIVELIDRVELVLNENEKLDLGCNKEGDGLENLTEDIRKTAEEVKQEFGGKIKIFVVDASSTSMWKEVIGKKLTAVQLSKEGEYYKADSAVLNFEGEMRIISIHPLDGLIIDYYESD